MSDADCTPGREPCSVAASFLLKVQDRLTYILLLGYFDTDDLAPQSTNVKNPAVAVYSVVFTGETTS